MPEYEGYYEVSSLGNVRSVPRTIEKRNGRSERRAGVNLQLATDMYGYRAVSLTKSNRSKMHKAHRLVALAFLPNPHRLPQVNHKNGNKQDNAVSNLEWCTNKENIVHSAKMGMHCQGQRHKNSKPVLDKLTGNVYVSIKEASTATGVSHSSLRCWLNGHRKQPHERFVLCDATGNYIIDYPQMSVD